MWQTVTTFIYLYLPLCLLGSSLLLCLVVVVYMGLSGHKWTDRHSRNASITPPLRLMWSRSMAVSYKRSANLYTNEPTTDTQATKHEKIGTARTAGTHSRTAG